MCGQVIETGVFMKQAKVEVYLLELKLCENSNLDHQITKSFSKEDTIGESASLSTFPGRQDLSEGLDAQVPAENFM